MRSKSNSQLMTPSQSGILVRRRIIFGAVCIIIILLLYMESNLLSTSLGNNSIDPDKLVLEFYGNNIDKESSNNNNNNDNPDANEKLQESSPSNHILGQPIPKKSSNVQHGIVKDDDNSEISDENLKSMDLLDDNFDFDEHLSQLSLNHSDWDRETIWYHHIEQEQTRFDVTWHLLNNDHLDIIINKIESEHCDKNDYLLDIDTLQNKYNLNPLHPNFDSINLMPLPKRFTLYSKRIAIRGKQLKFECNMMDNIMIENIINQYLPLMFDHILNTEDIDNINIDYYYFETVEIKIKNMDITILTQDTDESYQIFIPFNNKNCHSIHIFANTIFGIFHAMETLSQLIEYNFDLNIYEIKYIGYIYDYPYYKYRGVSLDTSRHFYPIKSIKKFLDSMIYTKFNVFHWHIVDDQSWPYPLKIYPSLFINASYSKQERYSMNDIYDIINYAKLRGLRVIPEFDSPAHVGSLCRVLDICMNEFCTRSTNGLLDPRKSNSLQVIYNIYREIIEIFDDEYIHIGHDEADYKKCFTQNTELKDWVRDNVPKGKKRSKKELGVYYYFLDKTYNFIKTEINKKIIAWDDIWFKLRKKFDIPNDIILIFWRQAWKQKLWEMMKMNYTVIMSEPFYIDLTMNDLKRRYYWDIWMVEDEKKKGNNYKEWWRNNILGGQACVWSERIDISVLDAKLFPDLSAISENLWLGGPIVKYNNWINVKNRLKWHRCLLLKRGIGGSPIDSNRTNLYRRHPQRPGSCYHQ